jgi:hypothetical protein
MNSKKWILKVLSGYEYIGSIKYDEEPQKFNMYLFMSYKNLTRLLDK